MSKRLKEWRLAEYRRVADAEVVGRPVVRMYRSELRLLLDERDALLGTLTFARRRLRAMLAAYPDEGRRATVLRQVVAEIDATLEDRERRLRPMADKDYHDDLAGIAREVFPVFELYGWNVTGLLAQTPESIEGDLREMSDEMVGDDDINFMERGHIRVEALREDESRQMFGFRVLLPVIYWDNEVGQS